MVLEVDYKGSPDQLLESIKIIENDMGENLHLDMDQD